MHNAFDVFVDGRACIRRVVAQAMVGAVMLAATLLVLSRAVACLSVGAEPALQSSILVTRTFASVQSAEEGCRSRQVAPAIHSVRAQPMGVCRT